MGENMRIRFGGALFLLSFSLFSCALAQDMTAPTLPRLSSIADNTSANSDPLRQYTDLLAQADEALRSEVARKDRIQFYSKIKDIRENLSRAEPRLTDLVFQKYGELLNQRDDLNQAYMKVSELGVRPRSVP